MPIPILIPIPIQIQIPIPMPIPTVRNQQKARARLVCRVVAARPVYTTCRRWEQQIGVQENVYSL